MSTFSNLNKKLYWFVDNIASKPVSLSLFVIPIPIIGLLLEFYFFKTSFGRSGAVLVCVAVFCVFVNHFLSEELKHVQGVLQSVKIMGSTQEEISRNINPNIKGDLSQQLPVNLYHMLQASEKEFPKLNSAKDKLVKVEFLTASIGTLIWGFGDLI